MKPVTAYIHFSKPGSRNGKPWTVHTSKECIQAPLVRITVPTETVFKANNKSNPKAFIKTRGFINQLKDGTVIIS